MKPAAFDRPWTAAELATLRRCYAVGGYLAALPHLPGRTAGAVLHKARRIGLVRRRRWTREDDAALRRLWSQALSLRTVAKQLGRTRATIYWRAQKLGLTGRVPPDHEYLTDAARRTGYCTTQLRRILRRAGVAIKVAFGRPTRSRTGRRFHVVETFAVDEALEAYHRTEPAESIARRLGVSGDLLRGRARLAGLRAPAKKAHLRLTDEQARQLLEAA